VLLLHPQVIKMSLTFSKFAQLPTVLLDIITVLLLHPQVIKICH